MSSRVPVLVLLLVGTSGCATLQQVSSGHVGCRPEEISISNQESGFGSGTWTAECKGQRYFCSSVSGSGASASKQVSCTPEAPAAPTSAGSASAGGCAYDTQCKGDRICNEGKCVEPPPK